MFKIIPGSGTTNGNPIQITALDQAGAQTLHTAISGTSDTQYDLVTVEASNKGVDTRKIFFEINGEVMPPVKIPRNEFMLIILDSQYMRNAETLKAYSDVAEDVFLNVKVNRTTS